MPPCSPRARCASLRRIAAVLVIAVIGGSVARPASAQQTDVIRGRVVGPDTAPIADVAVKATSYVGGVSKSTKTDKAGRLARIFVKRAGGDWIDFARIGYAPKRFEIKRIGDEEVLIANARLVEASTKMDAVEVLGQRNRRLPARAANAPDVGGGDRALGTAPLSPDQAGNLAAMAAATAGLQIIPGLDGATDMYSMLGLSGEQNNTTFEGLSSGVTALPPDILASTSLRPYPFDPSIGGFSGAQISIQTLPGTNFSRRLVTTTAITPPLEWASPIAAAQGQKYTNARLGGNAAGPIVQDRAFYNVAYNAGRQFNDLQTLLNTSTLGLRAAGVAADSVNRLFSILRSNRIPIDRSDPAATQARDVAQLAGNVDLTPSASGAGNAFTIGGAASYQGTHPISRGGLLLATPSHTGDVATWGANTMITHSAYFGFGALSKTTLGLAAESTNARPFESVPEGTVRIASVFDDGGSSVKTLTFGGNPLRSSSATRAIQATNQISWYTLDDHHTIKLATSVTADGSRDETSTSELGTFRYNSLADFDAGLPASFTRMVTPTPRQGSQVAASASLGDAWRPTEGLQVQYGVRADANHFLATPARNEDLLKTFGLDNSATPNRAYVRPACGDAVVLWSCAGGCLRAGCRPRAPGRGSCRRRRIPEYRIVEPHQSRGRVDRVGERGPVHHVRGRRGRRRPPRIGARSSLTRHRYQRVAPTGRLDRRSARRRRTSHSSIGASARRNPFAPPRIGPARSPTTASCWACSRSYHRAGISRVRWIAISIRRLGSRSPTKATVRSLSICRRSCRRRARCPRSRADCRRLISMCGSSSRT